MHEYPQTLKIKEGTPREVPISREVEPGVRQTGTQVIRTVDLTLEFQGQEITIRVDMGDFVMMVDDYRYKVNGVRHRDIIPVRYVHLQNNRNQIDMMRGIEDDEQ